MANSAKLDLKQILKSGLQFGHGTSKWNPKMAQYIFGAKNGVHVIDVVKTREQLLEALAQIEKLAGEGEVLFVGTKRQAAAIVQSEAVRAGAHFVTARWPGGLFTNFRVISMSIKKLNELERGFAEGVEGRTKYEVSRMKSEWQRLSRLYSGVKNMTSLPKAVFIVDPKFEAVAAREVRKVHIPVFGLVDTNADPDMVDYVVPGNDDALGAIELVVQAFADAVLAGNKGNGIKHDLRDYSSVEVELRKVEEVEDLVEKVAESVDKQEEKPTVIARTKSKGSDQIAGGGILEKVQQESEQKRKAKK